MLEAAIVAGALFVGSTPCDALPRRFVGVPAGAECERITWELTLSDPADASYRLSAVYGMSAVNDPGFANGGTRVELRGTWTLATGMASDPRAVVYRLAAPNPERTMDFALVDEELLHPLNERRALMVGNASWSYTLSRKTDGRRPARGPYARWLEGPVSSSQNGASVTDLTGVFEGRTACQDVARVLNVPVGGDCFKVKWRLTLSRDPETLARGTYKLEGSKYRNPPRTGTWAIRSVPGDTRVVYMLDPQAPGGFLSLLRADDNILLMLDRAGRVLVGDILFSYTLNRVK